MGKGQNLFISSRLRESDFQGPSRSKPAGHNGVTVKGFGRTDTKIRRVPQGLAEDSTSAASNKLDGGPAPPALVFLAFVLSSANSIDEMKRFCPLIITI